jgi:hypothetical protein
MKNIIRWIITLCRKEQLDYFYCLSNDIPNTYSTKCVYIIGVKESPWCVAFICPCGCKEKIILNTLTEATPCWKFYTKKNQISIFPSINRIIGCRSHFFIRNGNVEWKK